MAAADGFKFGDMVENGWASEDNPTRVGYYIRTTKAGVEMTDGHGTTWTINNDKNSKFRLVEPTSPLRASNRTPQAGSLTDD